MSKSLIALVAIAVAVDGVRSIINPGEAVTGLSAWDEQELKRVGAIQDTDEVAADDKAAASADRKLKAEFAAARKQELARSASTDVPGA